MTVTDAYCHGDEFSVVDGHKRLSDTSPVTETLRNCSPRFYLSDIARADASMSDPTFSHGTFYLAPGSHSLNFVNKTIWNNTDPGSIAFFRLENHPADVRGLPGRWLEELRHPVQEPVAVPAGRHRDQAADHDQRRAGLVRDLTVRNRRPGSDAANSSKETTWTFRSPAPLTPGKAYDPIVISFDIGSGSAVIDAVYNFARPMTASASAKGYATGTGCGWYQP